MNGKNFFDSLTINECVNRGLHIEDSANNAIIHEAIIFDQLGGNQSALKQFYANIGGFGKRDGVLNESAVFNNQLNLSKSESLAETATILTLANESADGDYLLFTKAILLAEAALGSMKTKYKGVESAERLEKCKKNVKGNARVQDALDKLKADHKANEKEK